MNRSGDRWRPLVRGGASFVVIIIVWQLAVDLGLIQPFFVSSPTLIAREFASQLQSGLAIKNVSVSLYEFGCALGLAIVFGVGLGVIAGWSSTIEYVLEPFIWFNYSAPIIAFYPIFIAILGLGKPTIIAISFGFALTPIYVNTLTGIKNVDRDLVTAARAFGARPHELFLKVILPGSAPTIVAGLRLAVGRALTGVIVAELFGATSGLGFSIAYFGQKLRTTEMMVSIVMVMVLGVIFTQTLSFLESVTDSWRSGPGR